MAEDFYIRVQLDPSAYARAQQKLRQLNIPQTPASQARGFFGNLTQELDTVHGNTNKVALGLTQATVGMRDLAAATAISASRLAVWSAGAAVLYGVINVFHQLKEAALDTDEALINMERVIDGFKRPQALQDLVDISRDLNVSMKETGEAAFAMGKFFDKQTDAVAGTRAVMIASKVAEIDHAEASRQLIAVTNAFGLSAASTTDIVDKLNEQQNTLGVELPKTLNGVARAAGIVSVAGGELDPLIARIATLIRLSGFAPETVARAQQRMAQTLLDPSKRSDLEAALEPVGIDIFDRGQLKDLDPLLNEIGRKFQSFNAEQQAQISKAIVGGREGGNLSGLATTMFMNQERIAEQTAASTYSAGSAQKELNVVLGSGREQIAALGNAVGRLGAQLGESGLLEVFGSIVVATREMVDLFSSIVGYWNQIPGPIKTMAAFSLVAFGIWKGMSSLIGRMPAHLNQTADAFQKISERDPDLVKRYDDFVGQSKDPKKAQVDFLLQSSDRAERDLNNDRVRSAEEANRKMTEARRRHLQQLEQSSVANLKAVEVEEKKSGDRRQKQREALNRRLIEDEAKATGARSATRAYGVDAFRGGAISGLGFDYRHPGADIGLKPNLLYPDRELVRHTPLNLGTGAEEAARLGVAERSLAEQRGKTGQSLHSLIAVEKQQQQVQQQMMGMTVNQQSEFLRRRADQELHVQQQIIRQTEKAANERAQIEYQERQQRLLHVASAQQDADRMQREEQRRARQAATAGALSIIAPMALAAAGYAAQRDEGPTVLSGALSGAAGGALFGSLAASMLPLPPIISQLIGIIGGGTAGGLLGALQAQRQKTQAVRDAFDALGESLDETRVKTDQVRKDSIAYAAPDPKRADPVIQQAQAILDAGLDKSTEDPTQRYYQQRSGRAREVSKQAQQEQELARRIVSGDAQAVSDLDKALAAFEDIRADKDREAKLDEMAEQSQLLGRLLAGSQEQFLKNIEDAKKEDFDGIREMQARAAAVRSKFAITERKDLTRDILTGDQEVIEEEVNKTVKREESLAEQVALLGAGVEAGSVTLRDAARLIASKFIIAKRAMEDYGPTTPEGLAAAQQQNELIQAAVAIVDQRIKSVDDMIGTGQISEKEGLNRKLKDIAQLRNQIANVDQETADRVTLPKLTQEINKFAQSKLDSWVQSTQADINQETDPKDKARRQAAFNRQKAAINAMIEGNASDSRSLIAGLRALGIADDVITIVMNTNTINIVKARIKKSQATLRNAQAHMRRLRELAEVARREGLDSGMYARMINDQAKIIEMHTAIINKDQKRLQELQNAQDDALSAANQGTEVDTSGGSGAYKPSVSETAKDIAAARADYLRALVEDDPIKAAQADIDAAKQQLAYAETQSERYSAQAAIIRAQHAFRDAVLSEREADIQFQLQMGRISTQKAIDLYKGLLKLKGLTKKQKQGIEMTIRQMTTEAADTFGIPSEIFVPSAFQVKQAAATGLRSSRLGTMLAGGGVGAVAGGMTNNTTVNNANSITINVRTEEDHRKVRKAFDDATGRNVQRSRNLGVTGGL